MIEYTKTQGQYLAFIHHYNKLTGLPPTEADIQQYFGISQPSVHKMVLQLEKKGMISRVQDTPQLIKVVIPHDLIPGLEAMVFNTVKPARRSWSQACYRSAYRFAAEAHHGQLFPGTHLPYIMHVSFVSMEIIACLDIEVDHDGDLAVQCALLHDVLEDTDITTSELEKSFGEKVAQGVLALSKNEVLAKEDRMRDSLHRIRQQPHEIWMVKLADRITNLAPPPHYWDSERIKRYRDEAVEIHHALQAASNYLSARLTKKINDFKKFL